MEVREIQQALLNAGFDPKGIDGIWGRNSIAAAMAFQRANGLLVDGIVGPQTLGKLFKHSITDDFLPWYDELLRKKGLTEIKDHAKLSKWLKSDGATLGDPAKLPWCGDAIATCIALTLPAEPIPDNPYWAQNWGKFGVPCEPTKGCVLVFKRPGGGHVGLYVGEDKNYFSVLGGNQSNSISISRIAKSRLLKGDGGSRWPATVPLGATVKMAGDPDAVITANEA